MSRMISVWQSMKQNMLFTDPKQPFYVIRVVGRELIQDFQDLGLGDDILPDEHLQVMLEQQITDPQAQQQYMRPKHPVNIGSGATPNTVHKLESDSKGNTGQLYVTRSDLKAPYDYQAHIQSLPVNMNDQRK